MRMSARIAILLLLSAVSVTVGIRLGKWTYRGSSPLAGATAASEAGAGGLAEAAGPIWLEPSDPLDIMRDVLELMQGEYVEKIEDDGKLSDGAVRTLLYTLDDPQTRYWTDEQLKLLDRQIEGKFSGIGAVVRVTKVKKNEVEQRRVSVVAPALGGPADRAGVRSGDIVTEIDGRWVIAYDPRLDLNRLALRTMPDKEYRRIIKDATKKLQDGVSWPRALEQLTQANGKAVTLTLERIGAAAPIKVTVERGDAEVTPVAYSKLPSGVGYLRITQFTSQAAHDVATALKDAGKAAGLVVDLRDNPGGPDAPGPKSIVSSASAVLGSLGVSGEVGRIVKGAKHTPIIARAVGSAPALKGRIAVIVNKGTSGIAEVVASALVARAGARLIGSSSQGDSAYQKLVKLSRGGMTLSAGTYITASGKPVPAAGLKPAIAVATGGPRSEKDAAVAKAVAVLAGPGGRS